MRAWASSSSVRGFLDAYGHKPGFEQEPERLARLEQAPDEVRLVRPEWNPCNAVVETWAGAQGWIGGVFPSSRNLRTPRRSYWQWSSRSTTGSPRACSRGRGLAAGRGRLRA